MLRIDNDTVNNGFLDDRCIVKCTRVHEKHRILVVRGFVSYEKLNSHGSN